MTPPRHLAVLPYLGAVVVVAVATGIRFLLDPILENRQAFGVYIVAVAVAARYFGFAPSLLAVVLSGLAGRVLFLLPRWSLEFDSPIDQVGVLIFGIVSLLIAASYEVGAEGSLGSKAADNRRRRKTGATRTRGCGAEADRGGTAGQRGSIVARFGSGADGDLDLGLSDQPRAVLRDASRHSWSLADSNGHEDR